MEDDRFTEQLAAGAATGGVVGAGTALFTHLHANFSSDAALRADYEAILAEEHERMWAAIHELRERVGVLEDGRPRVDALQVVNIASAYADALRTNPGESKRAALLNAIRNIGRGELGSVEVLSQVYVRLAAAEPELFVAFSYLPDERHILSGTSLGEHFSVRPSLDKAGRELQVSVGDLAALQRVAMDAASGFFAEYSHRKGNHGLTKLGRVAWLLCQPPS